MLTVMMGRYNLCMRSNILPAALSIDNTDKARSIEYKNIRNTGTGLMFLLKQDICPRVFV